jgi:hypothetical protein
MTRKLKSRVKCNPAEAALEAYEDFHGKPSAELVEVHDPIHYHKHLASAGELKRLVIAPETGGRVVLSGFKGALLCFNEAGNQLFVRGGDQSVDLKQFGINSAHEVETLGKAVEIDYHAVKEHLGDEGGDATYRHKFRQTNKDGKHVTLRVAKFPDVIYRVRDKQLEFSGGSYVIRAEGIDK